MRKGGYSRLGVFGTMNHYDNRVDRDFLGV